eukprot:NP_494536.2 Uncharacterized protein CELE_F18A12.2 [Caenorhabditis elegans]
MVRITSPSAVRMMPRIKLIIIIGVSILSFFLLFFDIKNCEKFDFKSIKITLKSHKNRICFEKFKNTYNIDRACLAYVPISGMPRLRAYFRHASPTCLFQACLAYVHSSKSAKMSQPSVIIPQQNAIIPQGSPEASQQREPTPPKPEEPPNEPTWLDKTIYHPWTPYITIIVTLALPIIFVLGSSLYLRSEETEIKVPSNLSVNPIFSTNATTSSQTTKPKLIYNEMKKPRTTLKPSTAPPESSKAPASTGTTLATNPTITGPPGTGKRNNSRFF